MVRCPGSAWRARVSRQGHPVPGCGSASPMRKIHGEDPVRTASTVRITPTAVSAAIPDGSCPRSHRVVPGRPARRGPLSSIREPATSRPSMARPMVPGRHAAHWMTAIAAAIVPAGAGRRADSRGGRRIRCLSLAFWPCARRCGAAARPEPARPGPRAGAGKPPARPGGPPALPARRRRTCSGSAPNQACGGPCPGPQHPRAWARSQRTADCPAGPDTSAAVPTGSRLTVISSRSCGDTSVTVSSMSSPS